MELITLAALGCGGYLLFKKFGPSAKPFDFQPVTGGVTKKPWKTRVTAITGTGENKVSTVEVWAPAGSWGPHLDLLVTTYQQKGSDKNSRTTVGTGANATAEMVTAAGQDFGIKKPATTVSGAPDHVLPLLVSGCSVGHVEVNHGGDHYDWQAKVNGSVIGGTAPTVGSAVSQAISGRGRRR